jgi:hypothetical protein
LVRAEIYLMLQGAVRWGAAGGRSAPPSQDEAEKEKEPSYRLFEPYFEARGRFRLDPEGRAAKHTHFGNAHGEGLAGPGELEVAQVLIDVDGANDWEAIFVVSLVASRAEDRAVVRLAAVRPIGAA